MTAVSSTVTREISVAIIAPDDGPSQVSVAMLYDTADPFAVHAQFQVALDQQITWVFSRELLAEGLDRASGDGDVRIWPNLDEGRDVVGIALRSPDGEALLQAGAEGLVDFLTATYALCPRGRESSHLEIDRALDALFTT
jgi:Streptomyces sporulation and cell division protein, SsgA